MKVVDLICGNLRSPTQQEYVALEAFIPVLRKRNRIWPSRYLIYLGFGGVFFSSALPMNLCAECYFSPSSILDSLFGQLEKFRLIFGCA